MPLNGKKVDARWNKNRFFLDADKCADTRLQLFNSRGKGQHAPLSLSLLPFFKPSPA
jgi:hypothetical protein